MLRCVSELRLVKMSTGRVPASPLSVRSIAVMDRSELHVTPADKDQRQTGTYRWCVLRTEREVCISWHVRLQKKGGTREKRSA